MATKTIQAMADAKAAKKKRCGREEVSIIKGTVIFD